MSGSVKDAKIACDSNDECNGFAFNDASNLYALRKFGSNFNVADCRYHSAWKTYIYKEVESNSLSY